MKSIAIISTGNELIYGTVQDTNSSYISSLLFTTSFDVKFHLVAGDNKDELEQALRYSIEKTDIVIITGGLGPTDDDNTLRVLQKIYGFTTGYDEPAKRRIHSFFELTGRLVTKADLNMITVPEGADIIENDVGLAPGFILNYESKMIIALPGVPAEMMSMFEGSVFPYLIKKYGLMEKIHFTIRAVGMKETEINKHINSMNISPKDVTWGITTSRGLSTITFVQKEKGQINKNNIILKAGKLFNANMLLQDFKSPEEELQYLLKEKKMTLATAESCTGGLISKRITDISGSSEIFIGCIVAYRNSIKINQLHVSADSLSKYGAVSEKIALEMVKGARELFDADISISVTGIAGPGGGSMDKPVGTVCFGFAFGNKTEAFTRIIKGNREIVRAYSALYAIEHVRRYLRKM